MGRRKSVSRQKATSHKSYSKRDLMAIHRARSPHAQMVDEAMKARRAPTYAAWVGDPNRYDIPGIDQPREYRESLEIKTLEELKAKAKRGVLTTYGTEELEKLEWQKKHPFLAAGRDGSGIKGYEKAIAGKVHYDFDVKDPAESFIMRYRLKKHDIADLKVYLEPTKKSALLHYRNTGARGSLPGAWYSDETQTFHLPPLKVPPYSEKRVSGGITKGVSEQGVPYTIKYRTMYYNFVLHEIGHHVHDSGKAGEKFRDTNRTTWAWVGYKGIHDLGHPVQRVHTSFADMVLHDHDYFGFNIRDWSGWRYPKSIRVGYMEMEAFAETFRIYRSGELKQQVKIADDGYRLSLMFMDEIRESKVNNPSAQYIKETEEKVRMASIYADNTRSLYQFMKKWDEKGWGRKQGRTRGSSYHSVLA